MKRRSLREWIIPRRPWRLLVLFSIVVGIFAANYLYRKWTPNMELSTEHCVIYSTATPEHTRKTGDVVEMLYTLCIISTGGA